MRTRYWLALAGMILALPMAALAAAPTDNPAATLYGGAAGYPAWTDGIKWGNVIDMSQYARGKTNFEKFENARDELAAKGGGVLYYPAGTYDFTQGPFDGPNGRGLMLKSGVVIRGDAPAQGADPAHSKLELGTRFVFGFTDRSAVAVDAGERVRFLLRKGGVVTMGGGRPVPTDLVVSMPLKMDGQGVTGYLTDFTEARLSGTVKWEFVAGGILRGRIHLEMPQTGNLDAIAGDYSVDMTRVGDDFAGTFAGSANGMEMQSDLVGKLSTVKPETPRDWNLIGLCPEAGKGVASVNNVGIAYVHLVGASLYFGPEVQWGRTWSTAGSWKSSFVKNSWADRVPDGTNPADTFNGGGPLYMGVGSGRLVLGCVFEDACPVNNAMTCGVRGNRATPDHAKGFGQDGFYMQKFAARLSVYGSRVFVAGNVLPKSETRNFKYVQATSKTNGQGGGFWYEGLRKDYVLFDYGKTCGIDINKDLLGLTKPDPTSEGTNGYFEEGVTVRDNYVFNNGHKGYNISGKWVSVTNNVNDRSYLQQGLDPYGVYGWRLTLDGFLLANAGGAGNVSDNLSRAFDMGGKSVWIDGNYFNNTGSNPGNDGEGILCQAHGGTHLQSWAITHNRHERGKGQTSYMGGWGVRVHGCLIAWNETPGWVGQVMATDEFDSAYVANKASKTSPGNSGNAIVVAPTGVPAAPKDVKAERYQGDAMMITWADNSDNEIGFRVDRSFDGGQTWAPIAYRPPHVQGSEDNPQAWADFTAPCGKALTYRVVALSAEDDGGKSAPTAAITIPVPAG